MTPERLEQIGEVLEKTLSLETALRAKYLDEACADDHGLRREVESLLDSHEQAGSGFLNTPAAGTEEKTDRLPIRPGRRIGPYDVLEEIGHGGMGEVFSAVRADGQYQKKVAIKLVRSGYDTEAILERFRNERQILAGLDHPNIARLLDGGTTDEAIPYLVMELVDGVPIDVHCDAHKLTIAGRLQLFRQVCSAVQYAHQHLVIHRDIKPGNILVNGDGAPKLLDFGIAKILDVAGSVEATLLRPMTPEYASPEQIRGEPITTATDVYSLGVVLYQLLTGRSPYRVDTHSAHALSHAITDAEPGRPSTAVIREENLHRTGEPRQLTAEFISNSREGSPRQLQRRLRGDLDFILLKAIRKEPALRYGSVEQFAQDIRNHLKGLPVTAGKGTWSYHTGKFIKRHKAVALATALVLVTLVSGIVATVREARIAESNRRRAEQRFNDVRQLADSLMFEIHDSMQDLPGATPARKLIVQRSLEYLSRLATDSGGDVSLQRQLANAYERIGQVQGNPDGTNLGDTAGAVDSFSKALSIRQKIANPQSQSDDNPADLIALAASYREMCGMNASFLGNIGTALGNCSKALGIAEKLGKTHPGNSAVKGELAKDYEATGTVYGADSTTGNAGDSYAALENHRKALALVEDLAMASPGDLDLRSWRSRLSLLTADDLFFTGKMSQALPLYERATRSFEDLTKQNSNPRYSYFLAVSYQRMGDMLLTDANYVQSLVYYRKQKDVTTRLVAADPKNMLFRVGLAASYATYGHALWRAGRVPEALVSLQHGLREMADSGQKDSRAKGLESQLVLWTAGALEKGDNLSGALHNYLLAQAGFRAICESDPKDVEDCLSLSGIQDRIARIYIHQGRLEEALAEDRNALALSEPLSAGIKPNLEALYTVLNVYYGMGEANVALARRPGTRRMKTQSWKEACSCYQKSYSTFHSIPGWHPITPNEFDSRNQKEIEAQLELCQSAVGGDAASLHSSADSSR
jgi:eukaryotic-like serine/threonine-protein kinase